MFFSGTGTGRVKRDESVCHQIFLNTFVLASFIGKMMEYLQTLDLFHFLKGNFYLTVEVRNKLK